MALPIAILSLGIALPLHVPAQAQPGPQPTDAVIRLLQAASETPVKDRAVAFEQAAAKAHALGDREGEGFGLELAGVTYLSLRCRRFVSVRSTSVPR